MSHTIIELSPQVLGDHRAWTYAQRQSGQKLHITEKCADGAVADIAICGIGVAPERGAWRMTINVPLGHACKRCTRIARGTRGRTQLQERVA